ncbi:MAG TPA: hypothetical protein VGY48_15100 [Vicinamibacterales bacterium]|jgi:hypothetical protein|nr:hypothetical protein [Vicinamibacterales bacterium]
MINRTFFVKMPTSSPTTAVDIPVQTNPGSSTAPVTVATDAVYYELRGRTTRFEQLKLLTSGGANSAWSPLARQGVLATVTPFGNAAIVTDLPDLQLSASFGTWAASGIAIPALADSVANGPIIRLIGGAGTAGKFFVVSLLIFEEKDENRSSTGH